MDIHEPKLFCLGPNYRLPVHHANVFSAVMYFVITLAVLFYGAIFYFMSHAYFVMIFPARFY